MKFEDSQEVLVFNCGSSSIKYQVVSLPSEKVTIKGEAERVGVKGEQSAYIRHWSRGHEKRMLMDLPDYETAFDGIYKILENEKGTLSGISCIGHRYVHAGACGSEPIRITRKSLMMLSKTFDLAPIHNPVSYAVMERCLKKLGDVPQFAVVDTGFHSTIPPEAATYPLPSSLIRKYGIRKFGFHGTSHKFIMQQAAKYMKKKAADLKIISCHLGAGGSSICAIHYGKSIENTMGFTPLQGLVMNTRSGDIDPAIPFYLMSQEHKTAEEVNTLLNKKSGLLGVSGFSGDMRDIIRHVNSRPDAKMAFHIYTSRVKEYISAYSLILKKTDLLVFTDTLGQKIPEIREAICAGLTCWGMSLDSIRNNKYKDGIADLSASGSSVKILVIPTDEELMIARECYQKIKGAVA